MRAVMNCRVCELAIAPQLLVVAISKYSVNPITNPNLSIVTHMRDNIVTCSTVAMQRSRGETCVAWYRVGNVTVHFAPNVGRH
jgi:hypothetical protein